MAVIPAVVPSPIKSRRSSSRAACSTPGLPSATSGTRPSAAMTITLLSTGDKERDNRRLSQIYGVLTSLPGKDQFAFLCRENGSIYRLDFPNDSTSVSRALLRELQGMVGETNIAVE